MATFTIPGNRNFNTAEGLLNYIETSFSGRFPIGENGCWHSGIHVPSDTIYPMIEGWLVAYRILSENEVESIPRLETITLRAYP